MRGSSGFNEVEKDRLYLHNVLYNEERAGVLKQSHYKSTPIYITNPNPGKTSIK